MFAFLGAANETKSKHIQVLAKLDIQHCDFSKFSTATEMFNRVVHAAKIKVDEEGTTAVAASRLDYLLAEYMQYIPLRSSLYI